ncbi:Galactosylceramide sulfotransferase [Holothuria leucospilota]|uniref:Galactosylceramide sulfotransferase n=1 Tax=Holothuria leucospilota TaxID=206669 RepID=A0A9Q1HKU5_HOLLE|nr:Galactosylceramide sulfotransferase [Holothuria leucospilota]
MKVAYISYSKQGYCCAALICVTSLWVSLTFIYDNMPQWQYPRQKMYSTLLTTKTDPLSNGIGQINSLLRRSKDGNVSCETTKTVALIAIRKNLCHSPAEAIAFIKTYKTGSTTVGHIMNRFGYQRNLSFVLNKRKSNGHLMIKNISSKSPRSEFLKPLNVTSGNYKDYKYDMISVHIRYNRRAMNTFMKPYTRFITIIRDPGYQFESAFVHFQFDDAFPIEVKESLKHANTLDRLQEWFRNSTFYVNKLKELKYSGIKGLRYFYAQNNQIFSLGLDVFLHSNRTAVENYISKLDAELDMVLITEYLEESLLVMKRQFCLQVDDILFIPKNQRTEKAKNYTIPRSLYDKMRQWNSVDYQLYQHFNATLWRKVEEYGQNFTKDLQEFRQQLQAVFKNCTKGVFFKRQGHYFENVNYNPVQNASELCQLLAEHKQSLMDKIRKRQL